jgi:rare lipoprotein A
MEAQARIQRGAPITYAEPGERPLPLAQRALRIKPEPDPGLSAASPPVGVMTPTPIAASTGPRYSYRYPDQPDTVYGQGAAPIDLRSPPAQPLITPPVETGGPQPQFIGRAFDARKAAAEEAATPVNAVTQAPTAKPDAPVGAQPWLEAERVGAPYQANGTWYVPTPEPGYAQTGIASWYGTEFEGKPTANGETYLPDMLTAAHPTLPIPSLVQVTNLANGKEVILRVNDRGPFVQGRLIDVSRRAADVLGFQAQGSARVHMRYLGPAPKRVAAEAQAAPPAPAIQSTPAQPKVAAPQPQAASLLTGFIVQVGAFSARTNAERVRDQVRSHGVVTIDHRPAGSGTLHRVRIGPWTERAEAETVRTAIVAMGYEGAIVTALR